MTRKNIKGQSTVERLLEQQRQYQDWLARLHEEAAGAAPSHVAQRVAADYAARLDEVTRELSEHEDGVREALADAEARSEGLAKQHAERTDELAEARLRRQVGEFDEAQYEEIASRCKSALSELSRERATVERDIDRYEEVLALIKGVARKPTESETQAAPQTVAPAPAASEAKERTSEPHQTRTSQSQMDLDEMAFLRSLTARGAAPKGGVAKSEPPRAEAAKPEPAKAEAPKPGPARVEPSLEPHKVERPQAPPPPAAAAAGEPKERRPPESRESADGTKTLVCTECGTKNLPSEWYCEKCGAELAPY